jgi:hypothetical protein
MLGRPSDFQQSGVLQMATRAPVLAMYAQDSIRFTSHLTVNAGLRWEPSWAAYDYFGYGSSFSHAAFSAGTRSSVFTNAPPGPQFYGDSGIPKAYFNNKLALFSPRLGLVWDPGGNGKQTIRVSGAILRDTAELFYAERLTTNAPYGNQIDIPTPPDFTNPYASYPGGSPFPVSYPPPKTFRFAPASVFVNMPLNTQPSYTAQWNVSYQRQLSDNWLASISYLGNKTTHVWIGEDINPAVYIPGASTTGNTNQRRLLYLENPSTGSAYASFGGELAGNYYQNPFNRSLDRGSCNFDVRHLSNTSLIVDSPMHGDGWVAHLLSGWQLAPIVTVASGMAINVTTGKDNSLTGIGLDRPNLALSNAYNTADPNPRTWLSPAAFVANPIGTFGNLGHDAVYGPGRINVDLSLSRTFRMTERVSLEARGEAFNAINHVNYNNPSTSLNSSTFGRITGAADPRIMQVSMKLHF